MKTRFVCLAMAFGLAFAGSAAQARTATPATASKKPNVLVIWGDDIGYWNVSAYNQGMMGCKTPNIDRIANIHPRRGERRPGEVIHHPGRSNAPVGLSHSAATC